MYRDLLVSKFALWVNLMCRYATGAPQTIINRAAGLYKQVACS
jgi:hypothetical protein